MIIETETYALDFNKSKNIVTIKGSLRLNGMEEYAPILNILQEALTNGHTLAVNLKELEFLNSSGIAMLSKFIIQARNIENFDLSLDGSVQIPWQGKSLKNLQRLFPALKLNLT